MTDKVVAYSTCGSEEEAARVATHLVERRVAACVNIIAQVRSVYRWKGELENSSEWMLLIKTRRALVPRVKVELRKVHSYEVPELIVVPVVDGLDTYLAWVDEETEPGI